MTPDEVVTSVRQAIDRTEELATKASSLCGCHPPAPAWWFGRDAQDGRIVIRENPHRDVPRRLTQRWNKTYWDMDTAEHIAHNDPSSVLRCCASDRRLLDEYLKYRARFDVIPHRWPEAEEQWHVAGQGSVWFKVIHSMADRYGITTEETT